MPNILKWIVVLPLLAMLNCSHQRTSETDEQRIWQIANDDNHPNSITVVGNELDLRGLMAFRVVRPSIDESFGALSCVQHGYLLAFRNGRAVGVKRTDAIRDLRLPDPAAASSSSTASLIAKHPDVLFSTEGATVGTGGYLLMYHMYEVRRTRDSVAFIDRWSDVAVAYETQAGFAREIKLGILNLAIPPAGASSFYYVQSDILARTASAKQCVLNAAGIQCTPWRPRVE